MARPKTLTTEDASGGTVNSSICPMNFNIQPFNVTVFTTVTGTATYTLQFTAEVTDTGTPTNWQNHPLMTGATTSSTVEFTSPVTAVRISQTAGTGRVSAQVLQAGI